MTERERELDALWIELAELQGWTSLSFGRVLTAHVLSGYHPLTKEYKEVPAWPTDEGAALALCLEIGAPKFMYPLTVPLPSGEYRAAMLRLKNEGVNVDGEQFLHTYVEHSEYGATDAEALSRLALAATRGE